MCNFSPSPLTVAYDSLYNSRLIFYLVLDNAIYLSSILSFFSNYFSGFS